jgi:micrococcal nuclease
VLINFAANTVCNKPFSFTGCRQTSAHIGRFFIGILFFCFSVCIAANEHLETDPCRVARLQEKVTVKYVIDGDTIILADDRHVRLIGIDTPEIARDGRKSDMGANEAHSYLDRLLTTNKIIYLNYDAQHKDHYDRTLGHLFLPDGTSIQSLLLKRGLAAPLTIPPNLGLLHCYQTSISYARQQRIGLWALKHYQPTPATSLSTHHIGYRIVIGNVTRIGESRSAIWINLDKKMTVRIVREDMKYFAPVNFEELEGKQLVVQGRLYFHNGEYRMRIRHPVDLTIASIPVRN